MRIAIEESIVAAIELGDTGAACAPVLIKTSQLRRICLSQEGVDAFAVHRGLAVTPRRATHRGNKAALPSKPCVACGLAMSWRRRWAKNWDDVKYCSDACRRSEAKRG